MNPAQQQAYLSLLELERKSFPTTDYLRQLIREHLSRVPFENASKIHYYRTRGRDGLRWLPDLETYLRNMAERGFGGNCYILNACFGELLRSLGYRVELVRATGGNTHLGLRVEAEGRLYYVDVGYGAPLFDPLPLDEEPRFARCGEEVEIRRVAEGHYRIDRRANGQSFVTKYIEWSPVPLESFGEAIAHSLRDEDENPFMRRIVATLFRKETAYSVVNHKLFVKRGKETEVHEFTSKREWLSMMNRTFRLEEAVLEGAIAFLSERDVHLFPSS